MSAEPPTFDDALRLEGIVLDPFKRADLWRRLSDGHLFIDLDDHYFKVEEAEDAAMESERVRCTDELNDELADLLADIVTALEPFAELTQTKLTRKDGGAIVDYINDLADGYQRTRETDT